MRPKATRAWMHLATRWASHASSITTHVAHRAATCALTGMAIASMTNILSNFNLHKKLHGERMSEVNRYIRERDLSQKLQKRVHRFYYYLEYYLEHISVFDVKSALGEVRPRARDPHSADATAIPNRGRHDLRARPDICWRPTNSRRRSPSRLRTTFARRSSSISSATSPSSRIAMPRSLHSSACSCSPSSHCLANTSAAVW